MDDQTTSGLSTVMSHIMSAISASAILGGIIGIVPTMAVILAVVWYVIAIWETKTVQTWWHRRCVERAAAHTVRLTSKIAELQRQGNRSAQELAHLDDKVEPVEKCK